MHLSPTVCSISSVTFSIRVKCKQSLNLQLLLISLAPSFLLSVSAIMLDSVTGLSMSRELLKSSLHHSHYLMEKLSSETLLNGKWQQFLTFTWFWFIRSQEVLLESMVVGENIAHNAALRENVFMMAVCVDLRIPLFLVGKPGSSKSLAKSIVADSMRGPSSQTELLKSFKQVGICFS